VMGPQGALAALGVGLFVPAGVIGVVARVMGLVRRLRG
jgi:hypothetical protein